MNSLIDLGTELLVDMTKVGSAHLRLILSAVAEPLAKGSPWVVLNKRTVSSYPIPSVIRALQSSIRS